MKKIETVSVSISLLILNDLHHIGTISDDVYDLAVRKLYEKEPELLASAVTEKEIA